MTSRRRQLGFLLNPARFAAAGGGALQPPLLDAIGVLYVPTLQPGAVSASPGLLDASAVLYSPSVVDLGVILRPPALASSAVPYAPTVVVGAVTLSPSLIDSSAVPYAPNIPSGLGLQYVGGQVSGRNGSSLTTTVNFALTGGLASVPAANDLVVITAVVGSQGANPAQAISGYTAIGQLNPIGGSSFGVSLNVSYKTMGGTPDTSFTLPGTGTSANAQAYSIQVFRNVDPSLNLAAASVAATGTATDRPDPGSITPTVAGSWVVICAGAGAQVSAAFTAPTNFTTDFLTHSQADSVDATVGSGYWDGWTSGTVNPGQYGGGTNPANAAWAAYTLVLEPA